MSNCRLPIGDCRIEQAASSLVIPAKRSASRNPGSALEISVPCGLVHSLLASIPNAAFSQSQLPEGVRNVGIDQRLNEQLPLDIEFRNEEGRLVNLGDFFHDKPVILSLVYHECPMLCNEVLEGMLRAFPSPSL